MRDQYTTLPDIHNRPLHMWLDLEWLYTDTRPRLQRGRRSPRRSARIVHEVFQAFESGSIQQVIYQIGNELLAEIPRSPKSIWKPNNRTWDTVAERGDKLGVYTDARPPYGCLGLRLRR